MILPSNVTPEINKYSRFSHALAIALTIHERFSAIIDRNN